MTKRLTKKKIIFIVALLIVLIETVFTRRIDEHKTDQIKPALQITSSPRQLVKVLYIIDGDTIVIEGKNTVRYIGIDTPETKHPTKSLQCFGEEASKKNKELVEGKFVFLEKDISETDQYKRLLRYVWLADPNNASSEGIFVNDYLVRQGYAHVSTFPPDVKYTQQFLRAEQEARKDNRGLWSKCQ